MICDHKLLSISFAHLESSAPKLGQFSLHWWIMADLFRALISTVDDDSNHTSIAAEGKLKPSCGTRISPQIEGCELVSPSIDDPRLLISKGYPGNFIPKNSFFVFIRAFHAIHALSQPSNPFHLVMHKPLENGRWGCRTSGHRSRKRRL